MRIYHTVLLLSLVGFGMGPDEHPRLVAVAPGERLAITSVTALESVGAPVVLLPAVLGSAFGMRHISSGLVARGHDVFVIDPLGMGQSSRPLNADYSLDAQARRVVAALDSLGVNRAVLAGHGTSASIAWRMAALAPDRVSAVVSIAGGPVNAQRTDGVGLALRFAPLLNTPPGRALARRKFTDNMRAHAAKDGWITPEVISAYLAPMSPDPRPALRVLAAMGEASDASSIAARLRQVRAPVRVLVGGVPTAGRPTDAQLALLAASVARLKVDTIADAGAMLHEERPAAVVDAIVAVAAAAHESRRRAAQ